MDAERVAEQLAKTLELVETNRARLEVEMNSGLAASDGAGANPVHIKMALELSRASVELSKEFRAWTKTHREMGKKLTLAERIDLAVAFVKKLHATDRREFLAAIGAADE